MNQVTLQKIDRENVEQCLNLKRQSTQELFVATIEKSLAYAYVYREQCQPFGIYAGEKMVGYVLTLFDSDEQMYCIWHMLIDFESQGLGYGAAALKLVIAYFQTEPFGKAATIGLTCHEDNEVGLKLYRGLGFKATGEKDEDCEWVMLRSLF